MVPAVVVCKAKLYRKEEKVDAKLRDEKAEV